MRDVFAINHHIMKILIEISRKIEERNRKIGRKTKDKKQTADGGYKPSHTDKHVEYKCSKHFS